MTIKYKVFRHSYLGFNSNSVLLYGEKDAILIDVPQLLSDSYRLISELILMKRRITHVYVTHFHPDHHFGLEALRLAFPQAKLVALPSVAKDILLTSVDKLEMWVEDARLGLEIPSRTTIPLPLREPRLEVEGVEVQFFDGWYGDCSYNSIAWIPALKVLYASDVAFHDCHLWTGETNVETRNGWRADLHRLREYDARIVIPAHCGESQMDTLKEVQDDPSKSYTEAIDWSLEYLDFYEDVHGRARTGKGFVARLTERYGHVVPCAFCIDWESQLLFPESSPSGLTPLPGKPGEIFLNPDGEYDGDPPKE